MKSALFQQLRTKLLNPRRLLLVSLDWTRPKDPPLALGHASILAHLRKREVDVLDRSWSVQSEKFDVNETVDFILKNAATNVDLGLGVFVWNELHVQQIIQRIKKEGFPGRIILGGSQISYTKSGLEKFYPQADMFIRGYAEEALARVMLSSDAYPAVQGVHFSGHPDFGVSAVANLEDLPSPFLTGIIPPQPFLRWETQRGCPFRCAFCQHRESDVSMTRRQFSETRIMQEVDFFLQNPIIKDIAVLDPVFNSGPNYMSVLKRFAEGGYTGKLALQCRMEMMKPEFFDIVQALNKTGNVVLEFGLQTIHKEEEKHIQRPNNMKKIRHVLEETHRRGIETEVSLIFGLPSQTVESFKQSVEFCKSLHVSTIFAYPLRLHRGTPLYDQREQLGLVESTDEDLDKLALLDKDHIGHVITSPSFSRSNWQEMAIIAKSLDDYNAQNTGKHHFVQKSFTPKMENTLRYTLWHIKNTNTDHLKTNVDNQRIEPHYSGLATHNLSLK